LQRMHDGCIAHHAGSSCATSLHCCKPAQTPYPDEGFFDLPVRLFESGLPCNPFSLIGRSHQQPDVQRRGPPENGHHPHWRRAVVWGEAAQQYSVQSNCFQATLSVLCLFVFSGRRTAPSPDLYVSGATHICTLPGWLIGPPACLPACLPAWLAYPSCVSYVLYRHTLTAVGRADEAVWLILHPCSLSVQSPFEHCRFLFCRMAVGSASLGCGLSTVSAALSDNVIIAELNPFFNACTQDSMPLKRLMGVCVAMAGIAWYTQVRSTRIMGGWFG
jgi:hypothetical protein